MAGGVKIRDRDRGAMNLLLNAGGLKKMRLRVGIKPDAGEYPNGTSVNTVAAAHEFGLGNVPQRSFVRGWFDGQSIRDLTAPFDLAAKNVLQGKQTVAQALPLIGHWFARGMKDRIINHIPPPLQKETIARKERKGAELPETPLVDTRQLLDAITWWTP